MEDFARRTAVITGAASGFGLEFARLARAEGMRLVLADVNGQALEAAIAGLGDSTDIVAVEVDVSQSEQVEELAEVARSSFGPVHLLFNNAGVGAGGYIWESSEQDWEWVMGVNLMGVVHGLRHFVPGMLASSRGGEPAHIVNTASVAGWLNAPLMGVYNVSKQAVVSLTETLYHDLRLAGANVGVTLLSPAFVATGIAQSDRNRPARLARYAQPTPSQLASQAQTRKAVESSQLSAAEVARMTFEAIRANRFYVFTHSRVLPLVGARVRHAIEGLPPADPYASRPDVRPKIG
jgi:NAD(P)-dependent dehydrogenase (short-subunit alcohol dehydrogenase family)